jgi:UDP-N-acetylmuramate-alanine ligase
MQAKRGIVIAGMHGKTTTSSMTAHVLREGGLHPSHYVGAEIPILGTNAYWNERSEYFVAEGDESDGTLRCFHPEHALILNIEEEHLDFYPDLAAIEKVFAQLIDQTSGSVFYNIDDPNTARLCGKRKRAVSYGFPSRRITVEQTSNCGILVHPFYFLAAARNSGRRPSMFPENTTFITRLE